MIHSSNSIIAGKHNQYVLQRSQTQRTDGCKQPKALLQAQACSSAECSTSSPLTPYDRTVMRIGKCLPLNVHSENVAHDNCRPSEFTVRINETTASGCQVVRALVAGS